MKHREEAQVHRRAGRLAQAEEALLLSPEGVTSHLLVNGYDIQTL